jgi:hypothetical protein
VRQQTIQSNPPAQVSALSTDLRTKPGQRLKLLALLLRDLDRQEAERARLGKLLEVELS